MSYLSWLVSLAAVATLAVTLVHAVRPAETSFKASVALLCGTMATGLLATVVGLIHSFAVVANVDPAMKSTVLANGISEAMRATAFAFATPILWLTPFIVGEARRRRQRQPSQA